MPEPERNLVIVHTPRKQALEDFLAVKAAMAERAPDIEVIIVENGQRHSVTRRRASERPTLIFSPVALRTFRPMRGKVYADRRHTKSAEQARLAAGGVPVPRSALLTPDLVLDETWGDFVVIKPDSFSLQGRGVRLVRRSDVHWTDPESLPADDPRHGRPLRVESFIDTGSHAESHRVMTVFGRPVYCLTSHALKRGRSSILVRRSTCRSPRTPASGRWRSTLTATSSRSGAAPPLSSPRSRCLAST